MRKFMYWFFFWFAFAGVVKTVLGQPSSVPAPVTSALTVSNGTGTVVNTNTTVTFTNTVSVGGLYSQDAGINLNLVSGLNNPFNISDVPVNATGGILYFSNFASGVEALNFYGNLAATNLTGPSGNGTILSNNNGRITFATSPTGGGSTSFNPTNFNTNGPGMVTITNVPASVITGTLTGPIIGNLTNISELGGTNGTPLTNVTGAIYLGTNGPIGNGAGLTNLPSGPFPSVWHVSPTLGNDANNGGTNSPFATLTNAVVHSYNSGGSNVIYIDDFNIKTAGFIAPANTIFIGRGAALTTIFITNFLGGGAITLNSNNIIFKDMTLYETNWQAAAHPTTIIAPNGGTNCQLIGCNLYGDYDCIFSTSNAVTAWKLTCVNCGFFSGFDCFNNTGAGGTAAGTNCIVDFESCNFNILGDAGLGDPDSRAIVIQQMTGIVNNCSFNITNGGFGNVYAVYNNGGRGLMGFNTFNYAASDNPNTYFATGANATNFISGNVDPAFLLQNSGGTNLVSNIGHPVITAGHIGGFSVGTTTNLVSYTNSIQYLAGVDHSDVAFIAQFTHINRAVDFAVSGTTHTQILFTNYWSVPFAVKPICTISSANGNFEYDVLNENGLAASPVAVPLEYFVDMSTVNYGVFGCVFDAGNADGSAYNIQTTNWEFAVHVIGNQ